MGKPTLWMRIRDFIVEMKAKYYCLRGWHSPIAWDVGGVSCFWCDKEFKERNEEHA